MKTNQFKKIMNIDQPVELEQIKLSFIKILNKCIERLEAVNEKEMPLVLNKIQVIKLYISAINNCREGNEIKRYIENYIEWSK
jgi:hypothetical protein